MLSAWCTLTSIRFYLLTTTYSRSPWAVQVGNAEKRIIYKADLIVKLCVSI